jgi:uncharacterized membrane protein
MKKVKNNVKKISKYVTNFIGMIMFIITGLNAIEGINIPIQVYEVLGVIQGVIGVYLVGGKLFETKEGGK